jgi:NADH-quinone oxidoreductase subunit G
MQPREGMVIKTNTPAIRKHRKMVLELILANHCRDCTTCLKSGNCRLQKFATRYKIEDIRFPNNMGDEKADKSSDSIVRQPNKCILCGKCVRMCEEVQNVGAIHYAYRGAEMKIATAFDGEIANSPCVGCGQCAVVCPTGAIVVKDDADKVLDAIGDKNTEVSVQIAPAVRVALGKEFGIEDGENLMGKLVTALKEIGFDKVYDTSLAADMTVIEETKEFLERLEGKGKLPMFTSCCPAWIRFAENRYPDMLKNISTCKSPMQMFAPIIKKEYKGDKKHVHVAIMPCTAKKYEAKRDEFKDKDGNSYVDYVLTTQEVVRMIKEQGIRLTATKESVCDNPFGEITGAGVIFGVTGGVTEAVLRHVGGYSPTAYTAVRGLEGVKETSIKVDGSEVKIAVVSGLKNAADLIDNIKAGKVYYDLVEVMSCPGGCINGGGQPFTKRTLNARLSRSEGIYNADKAEDKKSSETNKTVMEILKGMTDHEKHELLHVEYKKK